MDEWMESEWDGERDWMDESERDGWRLDRRWMKREGMVGEQERWMGRDG